MGLGREMHSTEWHSSLCPKTYELSKCSLVNCVLVAHHEQIVRVCL